VFVDAIPTERKKGLARPAFAASDLLPVRRDFAFVVDQDVSAGDVIKAALSADKELIAGAGIFDLFEGAGLGEGKKSLGLEVTIQPTAKTLTDQEIEAIAARVVAAVSKATGGAIRS
jgi:phenylalanyl-tRNA synthetase beta chain